MSSTTFTIEQLATYCKRKGFVYPSAEIYGGLAGFFDYGPLGVELKNNIKAAWWKHIVHGRDDVVGIDGTIITNPKVWKASGHVDCFEDILVEDTVTAERFRADHLVADALKISVDGMKADQLWKLIEDNAVKSPQGNPLGKPRQFNLMFKTNVGPLENENSGSYLRPETAQLIFTNFKLVAEHARMKLPFGIAQIGKAFRNEISPRDFLFRTREFEQMELEFFVHPDDEKCTLLSDAHLLAEFYFYSEDEQKQNKPHSKITLKQLLDAKMISEWHGYWLLESYLWFVQYGVSPEHLRIRQHVTTERSHYAQATFDVEYLFPLGWKEIHGNAHRGTFDLGQHQKHSKTNLEIFDEQKKQHVLPVVIEPSFGVDRSFLAFLCDAYHYDTERENVVLKLDVRLAAYKLGIFPLVNKEGILNLAQSIAKDMRMEFTTFYDKSGSIGRRYARQDEIGTPYCITVDFESLENGTVTIRNRDDTAQKRVKISALKETVRKLISQEILFGDVPLIKAELKNQTTP